MSIKGYTNISDNGLVFYVDAYNNKSYVSGDTTTNDLVNDIQGSLINGVGFNGKSFTFDGVDDYIDTDSLIPLIQNDTQGSIELWIKYPSIVNNMTMISFGKNTAITSLSIRILSDSRIICAYETNGTTQWNIITDFIDNIDKSTHLVITQDGTSSKLYLNGIDVGINGGGGNQNLWLGSDTFNTCVIGRSQNNGSSARYWDGDISNFKYYNRGLTSEEVKQNYNASKWRFK